MNTLNLDSQTNISPLILQVKNSNLGPESFPSDLSVNNVVINEYYVSEPQSSVNVLNDSKIVFYENDIPSMSLGNFAGSGGNIYPNIFLYDTYVTGNPTLLDINVAPNGSGSNAAYVSFQYGSASQYATIKLDQNGNIVFGTQLNNVFNSGSNLAITSMQFTPPVTLTSKNSNNVLSTVMNVETSNPNLFNIFVASTDKNGQISGPGLSLDQGNFIMQLNNINTTNGFVNGNSTTQQSFGNLYSPNNYTLNTINHGTSNSLSDIFNTFYSNVSGAVNQFVKGGNEIVKFVSRVATQENIQRVTTTANLVKDVYNGASSLYKAFNPAPASNSNANFNFNFSSSLTAPNQSYVTVKDGAIDTGVNGISQFSLQNSPLNSNFVYKSNPIMSLSQESFNGNQNTNVVKFLNIPDLTSQPSGVVKTVLYSANPGEFTFATSTTVNSKGLFKIENGEIKIIRSTNTKDIVLISKIPLVFKVVTKEKVFGYHNQLHTVFGKKCRFKKLESNNEKEFIFELNDVSNAIFSYDIK